MSDQTDLDGNRLVFIPSSWAPSYFEIFRIPAYSFVFSLRKTSRESLISEQMYGGEVSDK
jgi:hypothetical protein